MNNPNWPTLPSNEFDCSWGAHVTSAASIPFQRTWNGVPPAQSKKDKGVAFINLTLPQITSAVAVLYTMWSQAQVRCNTQSVELVLPYISFPELGLLVWIPQYPEHSSSSPLVGVSIYSILSLHWMPLHVTSKEAVIRILKQNSYIFNNLILTLNIPNILAKDNNFFITLYYTVKEGAFLNVHFSHFLLFFSYVFGG